MSDTPEDVQPEVEKPAPETDWRAEAEKLKAESRKWEARSKENANAARRLKELEDADKSEVQRWSERAEAAEAELTALRSERQVSTWRAEVAAESGLPGDVLRGSTLEELQAHAELLKPLLASKQHPYIPQAGNTPDRNPNADEAWASAVFKQP